MQFFHICETWWVALHFPTDTTLLTRQGQKSMFLVLIPGHANPDTSYYLLIIGRDVACLVPFGAWKGCQGLSNNLWVPLKVKSASSQVAVGSLGGKQLIMSCWKKKSFYFLLHRLESIWIFWLNVHLFCFRPEGRKAIKTWANMHIPLLSFLLPTDYIISASL